MADMIRELRGYDPKPGLRFSTESAAPVTPDRFVRPTREGWAIEVNSATLPRVLINRTYYVELAYGPPDRNSKAWLADGLARADRSEHSRERQDVVSTCRYRGGASY